jgi:hypothetical protein
VARERIEPLCLSEVLRITKAGVTKFLGLLAEKGKIFRQLVVVVACRRTNPGWSVNCRQ